MGGRGGCGWLVHAGRPRRHTRGPPAPRACGRTVPLGPLGGTRRAPRDRGRPETRFDERPPASGVSPGRSTVSTSRCTARCPASSSKRSWCSSDPGRPPPAPVGSGCGRATARGGRERTASSPRTASPPMERSKPRPRPGGSTTNAIECCAPRRGSGHRSVSTSWCRGHSRRRTRSPTRRVASSPNLWWPEDRAWLVSTEVDGLSSYIGGASNLIEMLLMSETIEAVPSSLDSRLVE